MKTVAFSLPKMWADHHTLSVRMALGQVAGVKEVKASSTNMDVLIHYDPSLTTPDALAQVLAGAGYEVGAAPELPTHPKRIHDQSDWFQFQERITVTDHRDLVMSGDHRKY